MAPKKNTLPCPLPEGWIVTDTEKRKWRLGKIIGEGGFGLIYTASDRVEFPVTEATDYVIKVEYHENGPLFSELKFYQRAAKAESIRKWKKGKKLDFLGIPKYWGSGLSEYREKRYRFMVLDRLGTDLQQLLENGELLKKQTVLQLGYLMVDVLEYIHDNEYVHADIKAANLLLGHRDPNNVYLADYGLSYRYSPNGEHKDYKENPKKGHNGTIEYTSIDAHRGVAPSRRGDLEVLGYCLLHWQCGTLPWLSMPSNPVKVQEAKAKLMDNLPYSVIQLSTPGNSLAEIAHFLLAVKMLGYKEKPNYDSLRKVLSHVRPQGILDLSRPKARVPSRPTENRGMSHAHPSTRTTKRKYANHNEDHTKPYSRMEKTTITKEKKAINSAADIHMRSRCLSSDDHADHHDPLPRSHPKAQEEAKQGKRHEQIFPVYGMRRRDEDGLQMWNKPKLRDSNPYITAHCERDWDKPSYWEEMNDNGHNKMKANVHYTVHTERNDGPNLKDKPFKLWSWKSYAVLIVALFIFWLFLISVKDAVLSLKFHPS